MSFKVKTKIILIIVAILFIIIGTQSVVSSYVFANEYTDTMKSKVVAIANSLKVQLNRLLRFGIALEELTGFEKQCQEIVDNYEEISYAMVTNTNGSILFCNEQSQMGTVVGNSAILKTVKTNEEKVLLTNIDGKNYYVAIIPVNDTSGIHVGAVAVNFPEEYISHKSETIFLQSMGIGSILFGIAVILMIFSFSKWVTKPLNKLTTVIQDIRKSGNLDKKVEIQSKDELGELAEVFNQMTAELKVSKKKMERYNMTLEEQVKKRTEKLVRSNYELKQFTYISSHHLQEPIRSIVSYLQLLEKRYKGRLDSKADVYIGYAVNGALLMKTQINDILKYHEICTQKIIFQPTDCKILFNQSIYNLHDIIQESGAIITHEPLPTVLGHTWQLQLVFENLISNAVKYGKDEAPEIHISAKRKKNLWKFSIKDNGIGIESKYFEQIFDIFQRLHTKAEYPGTGMGLAVCKKIIQRHKGQIWVESELGKGSTFHFTIPKNITLNNVSDKNKIANEEFEINT